MSYETKGNGQSYAEGRIDVLINGGTPTRHFFSMAYDTSFEGWRVDVAKTDSGMRAAFAFESFES